jgi:glutathione S-transferase
MLREMGGEFEDHRITSTDEWERLKAQLPFGSLPALEVDGQLVTQSHAIFRHLARRFGWIGSGDAQDALLDTTQEALAEAQEDLWRFAWVESYHQKLDEYASLVLEPRLSYLERWFTRAGRRPEFWVGDSPTHVDFLAFCYLEELDAFFPATLSRYEHLAAFRRRVEGLPAIAEYIESGRRPVVFGMGIRGPKIDPRARAREGAMFHSPWTKPLPLA